MLVFCFSCFFVSWIAICMMRAWRKQDFLDEECSPWLQQDMTRRDEHYRPYWTTHALMLMVFVNPKKYYGPIAQMAWNSGSSGVPVNLRWWKIYNKIYLEMYRHDRRAIRRMMARKQAYPPGLEQAIYIYTRADIDALIGWTKTGPRGDMSDAAMEYEEIMQCQELSKWEH